MTALDLFAKLPGVEEITEPPTKPSWWTGECPECGGKIATDSTWSIADCDCPKVRAVPCSK